MEKPILLMLCAVLLCSCATYVEPSSSSSAAAESTKYCVYSETRECFSTTQATCPAGGEFSDFCPFSSSSSVASSSSKPSSSSSSPLPSSSNSTYSSSSLAITNDPNLVRKNITLSYAGSSYADLDGNVATYRQAEAASKLGKIDLIAYCGTNMGWCENNSIYSPWEIDLFWTDHYDDYLGGDVYFFEIPDAQAAIFKTATKISEVIPTLNNLINIFSGTEGVDEIPIAVDKTFLVYTSEEEICIVIITQANTQSVDLQIMQIPRN